MSVKTNKIPNSDETARKGNSAENDDLIDNTDRSGGQTSNKSGKHSSVEKAAASRPGMDDAPGFHPKDGAHGDGTPDKDRDRPNGTPGSIGLHGRPGGVSDKGIKTRGKH